MSEAEIQLRRRILDIDKKRMLLMKEIASRQTELSKLDIERLQAENMIAEAQFGVSV